MLTRLDEREERMGLGGSLRMAESSLSLGTFGAASFANWCMSIDFSGMDLLEFNELLLSLDVDEVGCTYNP